MAQDRNPFPFSKEKRRKAEFIRPPNTLKAKVGSGGITDDILNKAQALLENNGVNFLPLAEIYLANMMKGIEKARERDSFYSKEELIAGMLYPGVQLKANGGMFQYPLVTRIADKMVQFLEVVEEPDSDAVDIIEAFHTTIRAVVLGRVSGDGGAHGQDLMAALDDAIRRYFDRRPKPRPLEDYQDEI